MLDRRECGFHIACVTDYELRALRDHAVRMGYSEMLKVLEQKKKLVRDEGEPWGGLIQTACARSHLDLAKWLQTRGFKASPESKDAHLCCADVSSFKWLRQQGVALSHADYARRWAGAGYVEGLQYLHSIKSEAWSPELLQMLMQWDARCADVMQWLHNELGATLQAENCNVAARQGNVELLQWLLARGAPLDAAEAANHAARAGQFSMLQYLDSVKTEPWTQEQLSRILCGAAFSGNVQICDWLVKHCDARVIAEDWQKYTFCNLPLAGLQWAMEHGIEFQQIPESPSHNKHNLCLNLSTGPTLSCAAFHWAHENGLECTCVHSHHSEEREPHFRSFYDLVYSPGWF